MLKNEKQLKKIQKIQKYEENYQCWNSTTSYPIYIF
jgi:hypothetical protein